MRYLVCASLLCFALPARGREVDRMDFGAEVLAHLPSRAAAIGSDTESIPWAQLGGVVSEAALYYGVGISQLKSEIVLRLGYRFAHGTLPEGSVIGSTLAGAYALGVVPLSVGWRATYPAGRLRALLGVDLGGAIGSVDVELADGRRASATTSFCFEARALLGAHLRLWSVIGLRLFVWGRLGQALVPDRGPRFDMSAAGLGIAVVGETALPGSEGPVDPSDEEPLLEQDQGED